MSIIARQSTARTVIVGPVLDSEGVAVTDIAVGDLKLSKNGAAPAALDGSATLTHRHTGYYSLALTTTDLNTVGSAEVTIDDTTNAMPVKEITVIEEAIYDAQFAASANAFTGAAGSSAVSSLSGHTAQTGDSFARIGAPAGASVSADIATVDANVDTLLTRITATLFTGITSLSGWLRLIFRSDSAIKTDSTLSISEINADEGSGAGDYDNETDSNEAIRDNQAAVGGLTAQETADAVHNLAPAGSAASGSIGDDLATLLTRTASGVTVTNPVSADGLSVDLVRGVAYLNDLSNALSWDITDAGFSTDMLTDGTTVTLKLQLRHAAANPLTVTGSITAVNGTTATVKFDIHRTTDEDSSSNANFGTTTLSPGDNRYRFDIEFAMEGNTANRLTPVVNGKVNVTPDIPDA